MPKSSAFDRVRKLGQLLPDVEEGTTYGSPALKVSGKMFACIAVHRSAEPNSLAVRMSFIERDLRMSADPSIYYLTPHYVGHPVVLARLALLRDNELKELLEVGWQFEKKSPKRRSRR